MTRVLTALALVSGATLLARAAFSLHVDVPERFNRLAYAWIPVRPVEGEVRSRRAWWNA